MKARLGARTGRSSSLERIGESVVGIKPGAAKLRELAPPGQTYFVYCVAVTNIVRKGAKW